MCKQNFACSLVAGAAEDEVAKNILLAHSPNISHGLVENCATWLHICF